MFLIDYGIVIVRKDSSNEIDFNTIEEFKRYAVDYVGTAIDDKEYVCYIPTVEVHTDTTDNIEFYTAPVLMYDQILTDYDVLVARKADPVYGLTGQDLIDKQAELAAQAIESARLAELEAETSGDGASRITLTQIEALLDETYDPTDYDAATDFASLKTAIALMFNRIKALDRKICVRLLKYQ